MPLVANVIKLNIDGPFSNLMGQCGWGFVARDSLEDARGAGARRILHARSAIQDEATACYESILVAAQWGMMHILVEIDCQNLVNAVKSRDYDLAPESYHIS
jgi:hypothetical protein